jgi:hypothetical protein
MRSLAAAISPGDFGFTDWASAADALSEIAAQVPIATRKNNALIIIFLLHSLILANALNLFGLLSQLGPDQSHRNQQGPHPLINRRLPRAALRSLLSALAYNGKAVHEPREDAMRQVGRQAAGRAPMALCLSMTLRSPRAFCVSRLSTHGQARKTSPRLL